MSDEKIETVVLIHGTFASDGEWWQPGSVFCRKLDAKLEAAGSRARCWAHLQGPDDKGLPRWDGLNSERNRRQDSAWLSAYLIALAWDDRISTIHVICHSHGGNVLCHAMQNPYFHNSFIKNRFGSIIFLGTPFLGFTKIHGSLGSKPADTSTRVSHYFADVEFSKIKNYHPISNINSFSIHYDVDEAFLLLVQSLSLRNRPQNFFGAGAPQRRMFFSSLIPNFYRKLFSGARLLAPLVHPRSRYAVPLVLGMGLARSARDSLFNHVMLFMSTEYFAVRNVLRAQGKAKLAHLKLSVMALCYVPYIIFAVLIYLFDFLVMSPLLYISDLIKNAIKLKGVSIAASSVLGDDYVFDNVATVDRVPGYIENCKLCTLLPSDSPEVFDKVIFDIQESIRSVYKNRSDLIVSQNDIREFFSRARHTLSAENILHCQYYRDDRVIDLVCEHMMRPPMHIVMKEEAINFLFPRSQAD